MSKLNSECRMQNEQNNDECRMQNDEQIRKSVHHSSFSVHRSGIVHGFNRVSDLVVLAAGGLSALLGLVVIAGWYIHSLTLVQFLSTSVPMQFNTALGLFLCGAGLLAIALGRPRLAIIDGCFAMVVGLLTLIEYVFGVNLGIDQLLIKQFTTVGTSHAGRMAPNTAVCFVLTGIALLIMVRSARSNRCSFILGLLGSIIAAIGMVGFLGYLLGIPMTSGWGHLTPMAVHTAAGFALLGASILAFAWCDGRTEETDPPRWLPVLVGIGVVTIAITLWQALMVQMKTPSALPWVALVAGLLLAGLLAVAVHLALRARSRAKEAESLNQELKQEITERQRAEEALRKSEERYRSLVESAQDAIFTLSPDGTITSLNSAFETITGWPRDQWIDCSFASLLHPDDLPLAMKTIERMTHGETFPTQEFRVLSKSGEYLVGEFTVTAQIRNGESVSILGIARDVTERKRTEETRRFQKTLLECQREASPDGILVVATDGTIISFNRRFLEIWGISEEVISTRSDEMALRAAVDNLVNPEEFLARVAYLYDHPDEKSHEEILLKDGRVLDRYSSPVKNIDGIHYGRVWFFRDITERKQAEEKLNMLAQAIRSTSEGVCITDLDDNIIFVNEGFLKIYGYDEHELIGKRISVVGSPNNPPDVLQEILPATLSGGWQGELLNRRKDGSEFPIFLSTSVVRDENGQPLGLISVAIDITERKRVEQQLRLQATALESAANAIIITDREGTIIWVNPAFTRLTGYAAAEALGQNPRLFRSGKHDLSFYQNLWQTILSGQVWHGEIINRRKDGSLYTEEMTIAPVRSKNGEITHFTAIKQDITERKQAEEELQKAKEAAEAANRAKSEFLATMSHEIRTPMNGVIGMTGLLLDTELTPEQYEYTEMMRSSAETLLTIINDILNFSRIEAGQLTIEPIPFDLRLVVEEVAELLSVKAREKGLDLIVRYAPDAPRYVIGDADAFGQVLTNLVGNAIKFTHAGYVLVEVECEPESVKRKTQNVNSELFGEFASPDYVSRFTFYVRDTGIGIPEDKIDHIFGKFTQADASTTRRYGGTGLGLAICKQLVELMGGHIGVTSRPGEGSTFWFTLSLPLDTRAPAAPHPKVDLTKEVAALFLDNCPRLMSQIREAIARGDSTALKRAAHTLKGSVGNFGAPAALAAVQRLETMDHQGDLRQAEDAYSTLEVEINRLTLALAAITKECVK